MGFLDLHGDLGRKFGSIGLSLSDIQTRLTANIDSGGVRVTGACASQAEQYVDLLLDKLVPNHDGFDLAIHEAIPPHSGLGSGTQMALAIGVAIANLYDIPLSFNEIADICCRGARSGIGIGTFQQGGIIIDGGRGERSQLPPVISRVNFPEAWRVILVFDNSIKGLHGRAELDAFAHLPKLPEQKSAEICHSVLLQMMPALQEVDFTQFGTSVSFVQDILSDHFFQSQGGRYCSPSMEAILDSLSTYGACGRGQTSWGPTCFAFYPDETSANQALKKIKKVWHDTPHIQFLMIRGNNQPATILKRELSVYSNRNINQQLKEA